MMALLWLILWKPVSKYVRGRADRVRADRDAAANEVQEAQKLRTDAEKKLELVSHDAETLRREINAKAESEASEIISKANRNAEQIVADAKREAAEIRAKALVSEREETVALACALAEKIIGREIGVEDNRRIADEFFSSTENGGDGDEKDHG